MKKTEDIIRLMSVGANVDLSGNKSVPDLLALAAAAAKHKVAMSISGSKKVEDLAKIVTAGRGCVTLKF